MMQREKEKHARLKEKIENKNSSAIPVEGQQPLGN
jgi:hypothetical protein